MLRTRRCLLVSLLIAALTAAAMAVLAFVIYFIVREALPIFEKVGLGELVLGRQWMPIDFTGVTSFGIFNFLAATIYVSVVGSPHYHALYAAGLVLMVLLCAINVTIGLIREKLTG